LASILVLVMQFFQAETVAHTGMQIMRRIVLHEVRVPFDPGHVAVALFLKETSSLMDQASLMQEGWFERLSERGLVRAAAVTAENHPFMVGESPTTGTGLRRGYYVDDQGGLRWVYANEQQNLYADVLVDTERLKEFFPTRRRMPRSILLYDRRQGSTALVFGEPGSLHQVVYSYLEQPGESGFIALSDGIVTGSSLETSGDDLMVISRYPFWGESWQVIALIVILPGAIFLLVYAVRYRRYEQTPEVRGARSMATKKESDDVVSEIDREISDLIDEEVAKSGAAAPGKVRSDKTEKKPVKAGTTASTETPAEAAASDEAVLEEVQRAVKKEEGEHSSLEKDGIIIRKG
jgi:hypothetical protein